MFFQYDDSVKDSVQDLTFKQSPQVENLGSAPSTVRDRVRSSWQQAVAKALEPVAAFDPSIRDIPRKGWMEEKNYHDRITNTWNQVTEIHPEIQLPPEELSAAEASAWPEGQLGVDIRPHLLDKKSRWTGSSSLNCRSRIRRDPK